MRNDQQRRAFAAQFRDEEGLLVFRYRQRGLPIEVSPAERDRAIERFTMLYRTANRTIVGTAAAALLALSWLWPRAIGALPVLISAYLGIVIVWTMMARFAWNEPTRGWRDRVVVGERLGWVGARLMAIEQARWRQLLFPAASAAALLYLSLEYGRGPWWMLPATAIMALVSLASIIAKIGLGERARLRRRRIGDMRQSRDLHPR